MDKELDLSVRIEADNAQLAAERNYNRKLMAVAAEVTRHAKAACQTCFGVGLVKRLFPNPDNVFCGCAVKRAAKAAGLKVDEYVKFMKKILEEAKNGQEIPVSPRPPEGE